MTPDDFRAWRRRHGLSQARAAALLGYSAPMVKKWETAVDSEGEPKHPIPRVVALACAAIDVGLEAL